MQGQVLRYLNAAVLGVGVITGPGPRIEFLSVEQMTGCRLVIDKIWRLSNVGSSFMARKKSLKIDKLC